MLIKGLQKTTLIDYPGKIASVVFVGGCNFRCPYCQNPDLVSGVERIPSIPEIEIFDYLVSRKKWLDGVCISGGEPTLQNDMPEFLQKLKEMDFLTKLDTNGSNPTMLKQVIEDGLVDFVAMDIKAPLERYAEVVKAEVDLDAIRESVNTIQNSGVDYEFRTTTVPRLIDKKDIVKIGEWLEGSKRYYLQQFSPHNTLDASFRKEKPYKPDELINLAKMVEKSFEECDVRGL